MESTTQRNKGFLQPFFDFLSLLGSLILGLSDRRNFSHFDRKAFIDSCLTMGPGSFPLISVSGVFVGLALALQTVLETQRLGVDELAGGVIAAGLLRELGPLTIGVAWAGRVAALVTEDYLKQDKEMSDTEFAGSFILPRWLAAFAIALPLDTYGLFLGFTGAAITAAIFGGISPDQFMESAHVTMTDKDVIVFFTKLMGILPAVSVLSTAIYLRTEKIDKSRMVSRAMTFAMMSCYVALSVFSYIVYAPPNHGQRYDSPDLRFSRSSNSGVVEFLGK
jgi:ABC-type transporter Mla maintaining outer membrane lipid asymmetry permease subunit MlaE